MSDRPQLKSGTRTIEALTGLRFFAAFAVILVHTQNLAFKTDLGNGQYATNAVTFFFVLSGFILTYVYSRRMTWMGIPRFYLARWARIWPLHMACLVLTIAVFAWQQRLFLNENNIWRLVTQATLVHSWVPINQWAFAFNGPSWSISTELAFYLAFPILLLLGRKRFWPVLLGGLLFTAAAVGWLQYEVTRSQQAMSWANHVAYVNPVCRMFDFIMGMAIGQLFLSRESRPERGNHPFRDTGWELLAVLMSAVVFQMASRNGILHNWLIANQLRLVDVWSFRGGAVIVPFAGVIWVFSWSKGLLARFMSRPAIVWLGEISFALYLVQQAVIFAFEPILADVELPASVVMGVVIVVSMALSALLFTVVEMPCRRAILELAEGRMKDSTRTMTAIPARLWDTGIGLGAIVALVLALGVFNYEYQLAIETQNRIVEELEQQQAIEAQNRIGEAWANTFSGRGFEQTTFDGEAVLLGFDVESREDGLHMSMLWKTLPGARRSRFIHITDDEGKMILQLPLESSLFRNASAGSVVLDELTIQADRVPASGNIGIGFYEKDLKTVRIDRGVLEMDGRRLLIAKLKEGKPERVEGNSTVR